MTYDHAVKRGLHSNGGFLIMGFLSAVLPSVDIWVSVPILLPGGRSWGVFERFPKALASEYVYDCQELKRTARVYGQTIARMIRAVEADAFLITITGTADSVTLAQDEWAFRDLAFRPVAAEPTCVWSDPGRLYAPTWGPWAGPSPAVTLSA